MHTHSVAIDKFWACEILVGKSWRIYPKRSFYSCGFGLLIFASISAFLKFCSDFTPLHMPCSPLFDTAPTPRFPPFARSGFLEGEISRLSRTLWRASVRRRFRDRNLARAASRA